VAYQCRHCGQWHVGHDDQVFAVMALAERHTFQILTKRPQRMRDYLLTLTGSVERMDDLEMAAVDLGDSPCAAGALEDRGWPLPNVWLGTSVENQHFADERIPVLFQTPAAVRFISAEPLLGPVNLDLGLNLGVKLADGTRWGGSKPTLDWVIVGGESGSGARPFDLAWARSIVWQCKSAGAPVFVKQLGANPYHIHVTDKDGRFIGGAEMPGIHDRKGGDPSEWPADLQVREFPC
jgi:protein gp37